MDEHSTTGAAAPGAAAGAPAPVESRELLTGRVRAALECAARDHARAALIVVQVDPVYALKALPRVRAVLEVARRERSIRASVPCCAGRCPTPAPGSVSFPTTEPMPKS